MKEELTQLYTDNQRQYINMAKRFTDNDEYLAEDIVQEAFVRALHYSDSYNPKLADLEVWLKSIMYICGVDHKRDEIMRGMTREVEEKDLITESDNGNDNKMLKEIKNEIEELSGMQKHICFLYFIRGYKPREIVEATGAKPQTVRTVVYRFSKRLEERYE